MKRRWKLVSATVGGLALIAGTMSLATAAEASGGPANDAAAISAVANGAAGGPAVGGVVDGDGASADIGTAHVQVPVDPTGGLVVDPDAGPAVNIGIPGSSTETGKAAGGNVVYDGVAPDASVVARPTSDGVQALIVVNGPQAPTTYRFPIRVGGRGSTLSAGPGGTIEVRTPGTTFPVATVAPAWARDANGSVVPTRFRIEGSTLVQIVDHHGAAYPVTADPTTCGTATCTYYFGKKATKDIAASSIVGGGCGLLKVVPLVAGGCLVAFASVNVQANRAKNRGMCLKIKYTRFGPTVWWPDIYSGKYCK